MTNPTNDARDTDETLWFTMGSHCAGRHYVDGNPHTFPGRIGGWCPAQQTGFFFSLAEIEDASPETRTWVAGFLSGNEPAPPQNDDGQTDFDNPAYHRWDRDREEFNATGYWPRSDDEAAEHGAAQESASWSVWRQDDNGNRFVIEAGLGREDAERMSAEFEARGHKQTYWISPD